jgi:hypothetical protein
MRQRLFHWEANGFNLMQDIEPVENRRVLARKWEVEVGVVRYSKQQGRYSSAASTLLSLT